MGTSHNLSPHGDNDDALYEPFAPQEGFELYRYRDAYKMSTKGWHGYYWARRTYEGDYEILSVPSSLGERPVPGGVFPREMPSRSSTQGSRAAARGCPDDAGEYRHGNGGHADVVWRGSI